MFHRLFIFTALLSLLPSWIEASTAPQQQENYQFTLPAAFFYQKADRALAPYFVQQPNTAQPFPYLSHFGLQRIQSIQIQRQIRTPDWQHTLTLQHPSAQPQLLQLLATPQAPTPFYAPAGTDIALQLSLNLKDLPALSAPLRHLQTDSWSTKKLGPRSIDSILTAQPVRLHLAIDFDPVAQLDLGRISIGRPHILLRADGLSSQAEQLIQHVIRTRNVPFSRQKSANTITYTLPEHITAASAGYLPIIRIDLHNDTVTLASSKELLARMDAPASALAQDPAFRHTWQQIPTSSSAQLYLSKHFLDSLEKIYLRALDEHWTNNPTFLKHQAQITQIIHQLNSTDSGLALSITTDTPQTTLTLRSALSQLLQ